VVLSAKDSHSLNESEIVVGGDLGEYSSSTSYKPDAGVPVALDGWYPNQESEFEKVFRWESTSNNVQPSAQLMELPESDPGLMNPAAMVWAIVWQCWALALWLAIAIASAGTLGKIGGALGLAR